MGAGSDRVADEVDAILGKLVGVLTVRLHQALVSATPVDTGFARAGWTPTVGPPQDRALRRPSDPEDARSRARSNLADGQAAAARIGASYRLVQGAVHESNQVVYVPRLNEGHSPQAAAGWVERAAAQAIRSLDGLRLEGLGRIP